MLLAEGRPDMPQTCALFILLSDPFFVSFLPFFLSCRGLPTDYWWCWAAVGYVLATLLIIILPLFVAALTFLGREATASAGGSEAASARMAQLLLLCQQTRSCSTDVSSTPQFPTYALNLLA